MLAKTGIVLACATGALGVHAAALNNFHAEPTSTLSNFHRHFQTLQEQGGDPFDGVSASCKAKMTESLQPVQSGDCGVIFSADAADTEKLDTFCMADCSSKVTKALDDVAANCASDADRAIIEPPLSSFRLLLPLACDKGGGDDYCLVEMMNSTSEGEGQGEGEGEGFENPLQATSAELKGVCEGCAGVMMDFQRKSKLVAGDAAAAFDIMEMACMKKNDQYCLPKLSSIMAGGPGSENSNPMESIDLDTMCSPCGKAMLPQLMATFMSNMAGGLGGGILGDGQGGQVVPDGTRRLMQVSEGPGAGAGEMIKEMEKQMDGMVAMMDNMCIKDLAGKFCGEKLKPLMDEDSSDFAAVQSACNSSAATCSAECKTAITAVKESLGCCFGPLSRMMSQDEDSKPMFDFFKGKCEITLETSCVSSGIKSVDMTVNVGNIKKAYVDDNEDTLKTNILADLVKQTGVSATGITDIKLTPGSDGNLEVSFTLTPQDQSEAASIGTTLGDLKSGGIESLTELPTSAREDPSKTISQATESKVESDDPDPKFNGAGMLMPGVASIGFSAFLAAMMLA